METIAQKSNSTFARLRRSIQIEWFASFFGLLPCTFSVFYHPDVAMRYCTGAFSVFIVGYLAYFWQGFQQIYTYSSDTASVKDRIEGIVSSLEKFTKTYFKISFLNWAFVGLLMFYSHRFVRSEQQDTIALEWLPLYVVVSLIVGYFVQKHYTEWAYGRYLKQLKKYQEEFKKEE
jgi:hypothetical protein